MHSRRDERPEGQVPRDEPLTDPKVRAEPKIKGTLQLRADLALIEYTCTDELWDDYLTQRAHAASLDAAERKVTP
jgi:hypothetical protein